MTVTLDWLGTATFRLTVNDTVIFLDAYIDRVPAAPPVGLTTAAITRADFVLIGHSHFDHLWGAARIARNTGATVIGSYETARIMAAEEVPDAQLQPVAGGERIRLAGDVTVTVYPSLHSCIWARAGGSSDEVCLGELGMTLDERQAAMRERAARRSQAGEEPGMAAVQAHLREAGPQYRSDGGALAYLIETPEGTIFWKDTAGHWTGILRDIRPDIALLAAAGRGNIDGEPVQGSLAGFVAREADLLRPRQIILNHHDDWMPPFTRPVAVPPIREAVARSVPRVELLEIGYLEGRQLFR